jgi:hypothetical protein
MKFTLPNCQVHIAKSSTPHGQCYNVNFPSQLHFLGCPNALQTAQVLKKKLAAQCLKFIPWSPKKNLSFWFFSLCGGGCGRGLQLATYPLT